MTETAIATVQATDEQYDTAITKAVQALEEGALVLSGLTPEQVRLATDQAREQYLNGDRELAALEVRYALHPCENCGDESYEDALLDIGYRFLTWLETFMDLDPVPACEHCTAGVGEYCNEPFCPGSGA